MTESDASAKPGVRRRLAAIAAFALVALVLVWTVIVILRDPLALLAQIVLLLVVVIAAWDALTRTGAGRWIGIVVAAAAVVAIVAIEVSRQGASGVSLAARVVLLGVAFLVARYALARDARTLKQSETPGTPVPAAQRGVLIMNLKSGGGKAERFHLDDECRARGIEPIVLQRGDDLLELARDAIDRGADVIGMAGGDGSQALVASVAAERGVPMVVHPGRHAQPLRPRSRARPRRRRRRPRRLRRGGRTPDRPRRGQRPGVREQRVAWPVRHHRPVAGVPRRQGGDDARRASADARTGDRADRPAVRTPDGAHHDGAHVIQVSNGPYGKTVERDRVAPAPRHGDCSASSPSSCPSGRRDALLAALATVAPGALRRATSLERADVRRSPRRRPSP